MHIYIIYMYITHTHTHTHTSAGVPSCLRKNKYIIPINCTRFFFALACARGTFPPPPPSCIYIYENKFAKYVCVM